LFLQIRLAEKNFRLISDLAEFLQGEQNPAETNVLFKNLAGREKFSADMIIADRNRILWNKQNPSETCKLYYLPTTNL